MQPSAMFCGSHGLCAHGYRELPESGILGPLVGEGGQACLPADPQSPSLVSQQPPSELFERSATPVAASPKSPDEVFPGKWQGDPKTGEHGGDGKQNAAGGKERVGCSLEGFQQTPQKIRPQASPSWQKRLGSHGRT